jgi:hypothetical protein
MNDFVQVSWPPAPPTTKQPAGTLNKKNNWDLTPITAKGIDAALVGDLMM